MGDSDDDYDRKRRDKFRGERGDGSYRGSVDRPMRPRDDWVDRGSMRDTTAFSPPSMDPPMKRARHDYYAGGGTGTDPYYAHYSSSNFPSHHRETSVGVSDTQKQPMSFKEFLVAQDDNISVIDAVEKYNDYRLEFQRQQLNEFFVAHKDEEWFRLKYHPEDSLKRKKEQMKALKKRVDVFMELYNSGALQKVTIDVTNTNELIRLLDTVVIKLEDGNDEDFAILEQELNELCNDKKMDTVSDKEAGSDMKMNIIDDHDQVEENGNGENTKLETSEETDVKVVRDDDQDEQHKAVASIEPQQEDLELEGDKNGEKEMQIDDEESKETNDEKMVDGTEVVKHTESISSDNDESQDDGKNNNEKTDKIEENGVLKKDGIKRSPRKPIHKTTSIFLRNLTPSITLKELEDICMKFDSFLRISLSEPQPDRRWMRRGWVTFTRDANIKEICWNLNNVRIRECELGSIVNRDLSRRVRQVNGITAHKRVVKSDIRISAKVALHLDNRAGLWAKEDKENGNGLVSKNPVLQNITDYLIEEASAEEEELLGLEPSIETEDDMNVTLERDESLITVLDRIIWYLRIVHSIDYYNHCEYPNEDEMPNRCGILHARGPVPLTKTDISSFIGSAVETKMANFLPDKSNTDKVDPKLLQISLKIADTEIDKFVQANTRELSKDKWLCPLSGKKFKGPDFVRKHIFNKHGEKIEEVKKEVEYFNNYLRDPKRPVDPTMKRDDPPIPSQAALSTTAFNAPVGYNSRYFSPNFSRGGGRGRGGRNSGEYRQIIQYRDLDAPRELDELI